jgi:hypothetical protein
LRQVGCPELAPPGGSGVPYLPVVDGRQATQQLGKLPPPRGNRAPQPTPYRSGQSQIRRYPTVGRSSHITLELSSRTFYSAPFPEGEGVAGGGVNTLVIFTVAGLSHELETERDLPAVFIGDPSSGPRNVIVQRPLVDQVPVRYQAEAGRSSERVRAALARVRQRLAGLDADRQAVDTPRLGLTDSLCPSARLADNS